MGERVRNAVDQGIDPFFGELVLGATDFVVEGGDGVRRCGDVGVKISLRYFMGFGPSLCHTQLSTLSSEPSNGNQRLTFLDGEDGCEDLPAFLECQGSMRHERLQKSTIAIVVMSRWVISYV